MIHPVKAATSYECDGCSHHASYHKMENKVEDGSNARWPVVDDTFKQGSSDLPFRLDDEVQEVLPKRRRLIAANETSSKINLPMTEKVTKTLTEVNRKRTK